MDPGEHIYTIEHLLQHAHTNSLPPKKAVSNTSALSSPHPAMRKKPPLIFAATALATNLPYPRPRHARSRDMGLGLSIPEKHWASVSV